MRILEIIQDFRHKRNKVPVYLAGFLRLLLPRTLFQRRLARTLTMDDGYSSEEILERVRYLNRLPPNSRLPARTPSLEAFRYCRKFILYFFDAHLSVRYFATSLRATFLFGDITHIPDVPTFVKSRPIGGANANAVLLKLDVVRHFTFVRDRRSFAEKRGELVGRNKVFPNQESRVKFLRRYHGHPLCDVGLVNTNTEYPEWLVPRMSMERQLGYKFILCLEGNDVATNLKWVMSSNSLAVMTPPRYETWFMEGTLVPDYHYVCIREDLSDLEERLRFYLEHPEASEAILANAHRHVAQFQDARKEELISLLVMEHYFRQTGQAVSTSMVSRKNE